MIRDGNAVRRNRARASACASTDRRHAGSRRRARRRGAPSGAFTLGAGGTEPRAGAPRQSAHGRRHRCADGAAGRGRPAERRRHAVKRGRVALDALDELKLGLLGGKLDPATLTGSRPSPTGLKDHRATAASTACWPRSSCGSRSKSPSWRSADAPPDQRARQRRIAACYVPRQICHTAVASRRLLTDISAARKGASRQDAGAGSMSRRRSGNDCGQAIRITGPSDKEPFMNERQREYFRQKLLDLEGRHPEGGQGDAAASAGREPEPPRSRRPRLVRDRPRHRTARPRPPAQADRQDRRGASPASTTAPTAIARRPASRSRSSGSRRVRSRRFDRGAGAPRAARARLSRRIAHDPKSGTRFSGRSYPKKKLERMTSLKRHLVRLAPQADAWAPKSSRSPESCRKERGLRRELPGTASLHRSVRKIETAGSCSRRMRWS